MKRCFRPSAWLHRPWEGRGRPHRARVAPLSTHESRNTASARAPWFVSVLSSNSVVGQRMAVSLGVELSNRFVDGAVEIVWSGERLMSEVMPLEVAPDPFDRFVMTTLDCWFVLRPERG